MAVLDSGFVNYTWEVFIILDADNEYKAAKMQKQTEIQERTVKKRCSSVAISKRSRKQFLEPAEKWQTICYEEFKIQAAITVPHLSLLELQIRAVVVISVILLPDFRAECRIWAHGRDCSLQGPQPARHLYRHFAYSIAGALQLPGRPE